MSSSFTCNHWGLHHLQNTSTMKYHMHCWFDTRQYVFSVQLMCACVCACVHVSDLCLQKELQQHTKCCHRIWFLGCLFWLHLLVSSTDAFYPAVTCPDLMLPCVPSHSVLLVPFPPLALPRCSTSWLTYKLQLSKEFKSSSYHLGRRSHLWINHMNLAIFKVFFLRLKMVPGDRQ